MPRSLQRDALFDLDYRAIPKLGNRRFHESTRQTPTLPLLLRIRRPQARRRHYLRPGPGDPRRPRYHPPIRPGGLRGGRTLRGYHRYHHRDSLPPLRAGHHAPEEG